MPDAEMIQVTIDGQQIAAAPGTTLLEAARLAGAEVPTICYHELTTPNGLCRQCVVEVEGWRVLAASCVAQVSPNMVVHTASERVQRARRTILEMLNASVDLSDAPALQAQLDDYSIDRERFPEAERRTFALLDDNPFYLRDYSKCVQCWRCVQACADDMQFTYALAVGGRGFHSRIATFFDHPMPETTCVFCGNCVGVCPTGALKGRAESLLEQGLPFDQVLASQRQQKRRQRRPVRVGE